MSTGCLVIIKSVKYPFLDCFMTADVAFYSVNRHLRLIQPDGVENIGGYSNMVCRLNDSGMLVKLHRHLMTGELGRRSLGVRASLTWMS
ncbi:hypothetical protein OIU74_001747 [Salix koriyanagi]|uniref:Uncharacterized protein n=1 Tax=Salix koriyanagi TaxID=2511006 RepID=A0A9Q0X2R9_9ROSI|nr:hypothetical protein OIU74_001747 [Salix koriyanagi]